MRCRFGIVDLPEFHDYPKKLRVFTGTLIQPVKRLPMLIAKFTRQPYDYICVESGSIRKQFAKVVVVGCLQLILNHNWSVSVEVGSENVQRISAYVRFPLSQLQLQPEFRS